MTELLKVQNLCVSYPLQGRLLAALKREPSSIDAVLDVSFTVAERETFAIVGESGSGKSTVALAISGLVSAKSGSVRFAGEEVLGRRPSQLRPLRRQVSVIFQDPVGSLSPRLTIGAILAEPLKVHAVAVDNIENWVSRLLDLVGLPRSFARRYPHQLSGGQARRINIARAIALEPRLIIADEPTAGLDVSIQGEILNLLKELQDRLGISILMITHNLHVVRHVAARMATMYLGRIVETGPSAAIFATPRHPYTAALLSASPQLNPDARSNRMELRGEIPSLLQRPRGCEFHPRCPFMQEDCRHDRPRTTHDNFGVAFTCHHPLSR